MRAFLTALCLVSVFGCTLNSGDGSAGPRPEPPVAAGPDCAALETILRGCSLLTAGPFTDCEEPEDAEEQCQFQCAAVASCNDLRTLVCHDGEAPVGPLADCFARCEPPAFDCGDGMTVPDSAVCDFSFDCFNGADEAACGFECANAGFEVQQFQVCDGFFDCPQGDDEADCVTDPLFQCPGFSVPQSFVCDGFNDCGDNSDEQGCGGSTPSAQFICGDVVSTR